MPNTHEKKVLDTQFPRCSNITESVDVIFAYSNQFKGNEKPTLDALQRIMDCLKEVTCLDPTQHYHSKVVVGYTDQSTQPNWSGNGGHRVHIPIKLEYYAQDKLLDACTHELAHSFYRLSALHISNEKWGDPFCEFLRGPAKAQIGQNGISWWYDCIKEHTETKRNTFRNVTGQILLYAKDKYYSQHTLEAFVREFILDENKVSEFTLSLFTEFSNKPMADRFYPVEKMGKR